VQFEKWDALGNTYLVVERPDCGVLTPDRVRRLCDPTSGIGSDGVLEVLGREGSRAHVTIWNPDGSTAEMSGNGLRIATAWLGAVAGTQRTTVTTVDRDVSGEIRDAGEVEVALGPYAVGEPEWIEVAGEAVELTPASVGNPHAVVRRDRLVRDDLLRLGPAIEAHPRFPARTNVQLMTVVDRRAIDVLVWERGAGETAASGSSSVAAAGVAVARGWCESPVEVRLPGGRLTVLLTGGRASLVGPVARVTAGSTTI
jgi:diaminopimelate epimerase